MQTDARAYPHAPRQALGQIANEHGQDGRTVVFGGFLALDLWMWFEIRPRPPLRKLDPRKTLARLDGTIRADTAPEEWWAVVEDGSWWEAGIVGPNGLNRCQANGEFDRPYLSVNEIDTALDSLRQGLATKLLLMVGSQVGLRPIPEIIDGQEQPERAFAFWRRFLGPELTTAFDERFPHRWERFLDRIREFREVDPELHDRLLRPTRLPK